MSEVKELKDTIELQLKSGFEGLQKKYDAAMEEVEKGNKVTGDLKKQIEDQKGELQKVIDQVDEIDEIRFSCPNKHHFLYDIERFELENPNEVFIVADRPYGLIEATFTRDGVEESKDAWTNVRGFC